jgi:hypothetical protein
MARRDIIQIPDTPDNPVQTSQSFASDFCNSAFASSDQLDSRVVSRCSRSDGGSANATHNKDNKDLLVSMLDPPADKCEMQKSHAASQPLMAVANQHLKMVSY